MLKRHWCVVLLTGLLLAGCGTRRPPAALPPRPTIAWVRPTPRPAMDTSTPVVNASNMPGDDLAPNVAIHPTESWAALIWANAWPDDPSAATVFVKVQDAKTRAWRNGVSVSTAPAYRFAGHPSIAIGADATIHAIWGQQRLAPHYSRSTDGGQSWSAPESLPVPAGFNPGTLHAQVAVDPAGGVHVLLAAERTCWDCIQFFHLYRAGAGSAWQTTTDLVPGEKHQRAAITFVGDAASFRTIVVVACARGCHASRAIVAVADGAGPFTVREIHGDGGEPGWVANWASATLIPGGACIAWGY